MLTPEMDEAYFKIVLLSVLVSSEPKMATKLMEHDPKELYSRAKSDSVRFSKFKDWIT